MLRSKQEPNEANDQEENGLGWNAVSARMHEVRATTKRYTLQGFFPDEDADLVFHYRGLTQEEADGIEDRYVRVDAGRRQKGVEVDTSKIRSAQIRAGVERVTKEREDEILAVITGWNGSPSQVQDLPADVRDGLAEAIDSFTTMDPDTEVAFRNFR